MHLYPVHDLLLSSTYLLLCEKRNILCLFCRLNLLNFSSLDRVVSRRKCKHKEMSHFYPNLFIALTYIQASSSTKGKQEKESGSAAKRFRHVTIGEPETSGVSSTSETGKFKGKDKREITC